MCGGGGQQKAAANSQSAMDSSLANIFNQNQAVTNPALTSIAQNGPAFMSNVGDYTRQATAQAYQPARQQLATQLGSMGPLPSGFATKAGENLNEAQAQTTDSNMLQNQMLKFQAQMQALGMLNPLGYASAAQQGNNSIMQMPVQPSLAGGLLGGLISAAGTAACWIAAAVFNEPLNGPRVRVVRFWLITEFEPSNFFAGMVMKAYRKYGQRVAEVVRKSSLLKFAFRKLFDKALCCAEESCV